jgi:hypothetical protein
VDSSFESQTVSGIPQVQQQPLAESSDGSYQPAVKAVMQQDFRMGMQTAASHSLPSSSTLFSPATASSVPSDRASRGGNGSSMSSQSPERPAAHQAKRMEEHRNCTFRDSVGSSTTSVGSSGGDEIEQLRESLEQELGTQRLRFIYQSLRDGGKVMPGERDSLKKDDNSVGSVSGYGGHEVCGCAGSSSGGPGRHVDTYAARLTPAVARLVALDQNYFN